jgi:hypothetical protein
MQEPYEGEYIAPSWSWASSRKDARYRMGDEAFRWTSESAAWQDRFGTSLLSFDLYLNANSEAFGRVSSASVVVSACCRPLCFKFDWSHGTGTSPFSAQEPALTMNERSTPGALDLPLNLDGDGSSSIRIAKDNGLDRSCYICMQIGLMAGDFGPGGPSLAMLILEPVEIRESTFRRVGRLNVGWDEEKEIEVDKWERREITLI